MQSTQKYKKKVCYKKKKRKQDTQDFSSGRVCH